MNRRPRASGGPGGNARPRGARGSRFRGNDGKGCKEVQMTVLLDPTSERSPTIRPRLPRPERLDGLKIGILDIAKSRGDVFLHRLGERISERGITVKHYA